MPAAAALAIISPAFRGGLIEALKDPGATASGSGSFPPRFAGASLKPYGAARGGVRSSGISPAFRGGLIEA